MELDARPDGAQGGGSEPAVPETRVEAGIRLAGALEYYWLLRAQGRENLTQVLALVGLTARETAAHARALTVAALVRGEMLGDHAGAVPMLDDADRIWRALNDGYGIAVVLERCGRLAVVRGDYGPAATAFAEARDRFRRARPRVRPPDPNRP